MWNYQVTKGDLYLDDRFEGTGYSGAGEGRNNPALESVHNVGPIPRGRYKIIGPEIHAGLHAPVLRLRPVGHEAFGRNGFLIHGNNEQNDASHGCIILGPAIRKLIASSSDRDLMVV